MHRSVFCVFSLVTLFSVPFARAADQAPAPEKPPTFEETVKWLKERVRDDAGWTLNLGDHEDRFTYDLQQTGQRKFTLTVTCEGEVMRTTRYVLQLQDLDADKVLRPKEQDIGHVLTLQPIPNKGAIAFTEVSTEPVSRVVRRDEGTRAQVSLVVKDPMVASRMGKAFAHLIKLCREIREPF